MKLLFITQVWDEGDSILGFVPSWVKALSSHCKTVSIICMKQGDGSTSFPVYSLGKERGASRLQKIYTFLALTFHLRHEYDTIFVHMNPEYIVLAGLWWRLMGKRVILWYAHGTVTWKLRLAVLFTDRILTSTPEGCRIRSPRLRVVGQAIDTDLFSPQENTGGVSPLRLVVVGRISTSKGQLLALQALAQLQREGIPITLTCIGEPVYPHDHEYLAECEKLTREQKLGSMVSFLGPKKRTELATILPTMTLCINMSTTGSLDKAGLEALSAGVPVITANEAFRSVIGGLSPELMLRRQASEDLMRALRWHLALPTAQRQELRDSLRQEVVRHHSLHTFADRIFATL